MSHRIASVRGVLLAILLSSIAAAENAPDAQPKADHAAIQVLFLGDNGHHRPAQRAAQLIPVLRERGITIRYTDDPNVLDPKTLQAFDGLILYANIEQIRPEQERALLNFIAGGKGFIPIHCASYCFLNSTEYAALVGAQFQRHGTGVVTTEIAAPRHPIVRGFHGFQSWDETYIHHRHNEKSRTVLSYRVRGDQADGQSREPWTWIRTHGAGRIFYTAWGHDHRTWGHPGFHNLIERGIRWAVGNDPRVVPEYRDPDRFVIPRMTAPRTDVEPFEYVNVGAKIPNYTPGAQWGTQGEPLRRMQKPLPPEESVKHFVTPVGFEMRLFAAEPDLGGKPICMTWDERGRLWVAETYDYPNELQPPGKGRDRIRICEDTDGDGRADKFTVFAEKLSIPTSIAFHRNEVIVQNGVETIALKDTDGDGRADARRILFTGWALGDTHGGVSNFQYGLDNWIWAMQGYNDSEPVVAGKKSQRFRMGFFRFRPDGSELEFIRSTNNNTWGIGISEEGLIFGSTANRNPSVYMPIPNRYYERVRGWSPAQLGTIADTHLFRPITDKVRQVDHHGGYTAGAGHALYTARTYPPQYWNRTAFVCGPTGHLVGTFVLRRDGADVTSTSPHNLVASDDEWSAPIMAEVGPDGHVWILDWYNYIVQHNPTPLGFERGKGNAYETDLRDKSRGRIYRLVYKGASHRQRMSLQNATPTELVEALAHDNMFWRKHAQRLLVERGKRDVVPQLLKLVSNTDLDRIGLNVGAIHALWTLHGLGVLDGAHPEATEAVFQALRHPSAGVRRNAALVLPPSPASAAALLESNSVADADAHVRLAALLALADMPADARVGGVLAKLVQQPDVVSGRWLRDALTSAAATHAMPFLEALARSESDGWNEQAAMVTSLVAEHVARSRISSEEWNAFLPTFAEARPPFVAAVLMGLDGGWPNDYTIALTTEAERAIMSLMERLPLGSQGRLIRLAVLWGSQELEQQAEEISAALLKAVADDELDVAQRVAAAQQLIGFRPANARVVEHLLDFVNPQAPPELAVALIESLAGSTAENVGSELVARSGSMTPAVRRAALRVLLGRPETTQALLTGIEAGRIPWSELMLDQKQALQTHPNRRIRRWAARLLEQGDGLPNPDRNKVLQQLLPLAQQTGDAARGKSVFMKQCSKCHTYRGEGQQVGPDLSGMAVHPKTELLTHIIDPSRSVEGNFRLYTLVTTEGRVFNGMLVAESRTSIELIDTEAKRHAVQREEIEELVVSNKSVMPEGFEKQVSSQEIVDLLEFLTQRGQYTPLDLRKVATIVSTRGMFTDKDADVERLIFSDWSPKSVDGVPFVLVDPRGDQVPNVILLNGPHGKFPPQMPRSVSLPVHQSAGAIHLLSGVSGWGHPYGTKGSVSLIVRLHYADGRTEDHPLRNGEHFADYIRRVDVPGSKLAFMLRNQQIRYLAIHPKRQDAIQQIEFLKGPDDTAPVIMAVTVESRKIKKPH